MSSPWLTKLKNIYISFIIMALNKIPKLTDHDNMLPKNRRNSKRHPFMSAFYIIFMIDFLSQLQWFLYNHCQSNMDNATVQGYLFCHLSPIKNDQKSFGLFYPSARYVTTLLSRLIFFTASYPLFKTQSIVKINVPILQPITSFHY